MSESKQLKTEIVENNHFFVFFSVLILVANLLITTVDFSVFEGIYAKIQVSKVNHSSIVFNRRDKSLFKFYFS